MCTSVNILTLDSINLFSFEVIFFQNEISYLKRKQFFLLLLECLCGIKLKNIEPTTQFSLGNKNIVDSSKETLFDNFNTGNLQLCFKCTLTNLIILNMTPKRKIMMKFKFHLNNFYCKLRKQCLCLITRNKLM